MSCIRKHFRADDATHAGPGLCLSLTLMAAALAALALASPAHALCVQNDTANLRSGPGTNHEMVLEVFQYMPFEQIGHEGQWYKVKDVDGDVFWVYGPLVTSSYKCAVVNNDTANVRTGPGTNHSESKMSPAERYYSFRVLQIKGDWVQVQDEFGDKGWIYKPLLWIR